MAKKKKASKAMKAPTTLCTETVSNTPNVLNAAIIPITQRLKVCRLCEGKDGPFLNIFDADKITAKKIEDLMPFGIAENDDLPHKICFRCSAKVEELYEFIQKCIKTQHNLRTALGKEGPLLTKKKTQISLWEEKLNKSNISNDDICDAVVKKAMQSIIEKDIPLIASQKEDKPLKNANSDTEHAAPETSKVSSVDISKKIPKKASKKSLVEDSNDTNVMESKDESGEMDLLCQQVKLTLKKADQNVALKRSSRSSNIEPLYEGLEPPAKVKKINKTGSKKSTNGVQDISPSINTSKTPSCEEEISEIVVKPKEKVQKIEVKPFGNFQGEPAKIAVKPCNVIEAEKSSKVEVNELQSNSEEKSNKTEIKPFNIMDHISTIKVNGVGVLYQCKLCNRNFLNKNVVKSHGCARNGAPTQGVTKTVVPQEPPKAPVVKYINTKLEAEKNPSASDVKSGNITNKPKPKIGPASKVKRDGNESKNLVGTLVFPREFHSPLVKNDSSNVSVQNLTNSSLKLVPGPNNTFTFVENQSLILKRSKTEDDFNKFTKILPKPGTGFEKHDIALKNQNHSLKHHTPEVIDLEEGSTAPHPVPVSQPYPVGLFQTVPKFPATPPQTQVANMPPMFSATAAKKQCYKVVRTANPNKLLISATKMPPPPELPKKRTKQSNYVVPEEPETKQPFSVTLEDVDPPKDPGFFTFINVDPLLQPSYVLPTDSVQESQISTSSSMKVSADNCSVNEQDRYSCKMCGEKFSREQKLLAHIHSHYSKMDEEDQRKAEKNSRRRGKKSTAV